MLLNFRRNLHGVAHGKSPDSGTAECAEVCTAAQPLTEVVGEGTDVGPLAADHPEADFWTIDLG